MKKILITGANSYIGTSFEKYLKSNYPNEYYVSTVDMTDQSWRQTSFSAYDTVDWAKSYRKRGLKDEIFCFDGGL